jgi:hypothetical protein
MNLKTSIKTVELSDHSERYSLIKKNSAPRSRLAEIFNTCLDSEVLNVVELQENKGQKQSAIKILPNLHNFKNA